MDSRKKILVTGANGQLGRELRNLEHQNPAYDFIFLSREDLPIHHFELLRQYFEITKPDYCINAAAYTAVDRAEQEKELAFQVNAEAVGVLAAVCAKYGCRLIHVSTDYVFDGQSPLPYKEEDPTNPVNTYGASKLKGEALCLLYNADSIIIRTAWVYSEYGNNFVKTMIRLMKERDSIGVVNDQIGAPTYAADLAAVIMQIVSKESWQAGIYHFSNQGRISWYDFALAIKEYTGSNCQVNAIASSAYPTPAKRPSFSLLETEKIQKTFSINIADWKSALLRCLKQLGYSPAELK
ncbi:MAG TPA: dTDP-4-dehydrorhamnose reductase [Chitinophagaceae bacterium]|jgi:dTDP-4-dehydrorhamnose reductase|nr:dTDP-4-dehydrorhamnose reductase [Chitinophagaceae bacterium]